MAKMVFWACTRPQLPIEKGIITSLNDSKKLVNAPNHLSLYNNRQNGIPIKWFKIVCWHTFDPFRTACLSETPLNGT